MEEYYAHIKRDDSGSIESTQTVADHNRKTAQYAADLLAPVSLSAAGYIAGLLHDMGKCTQRFLAYIKDGVGVRGSVNHTFAGVRMLLKQFHHEPPEKLEDIAVELLALAVGGHHGLFDCVNVDGENGFQHRLTKKNIDYEEAEAGFFSTCASCEEISSLVRGAQDELIPILEKVRTMTGDEASVERYGQETAFYCGLLARLLLSAVIAGDRRDTAEFQNNVKFPCNRNEKELKHLWTVRLQRVEEKLGALPQTTPIEQARRRISEQCRQAATMPCGVYRLNVPTGGGKTLSSLRYALAHAQQYGKQHLIFVSPLLSILDQNSDEIKKYIEDDSLILLHHSNVICPRETQEELDRRELLTETWDSPIVITTFVQLLNVLFSGKTSSIRRFHSLCNSVIIIDEVQTVPQKLLSLFSLAVNFLAEICNTTVILCSATQPCVERIEHPIHTPIPDLVPYDPALWTVFQRTDIHPIQDAFSLEDLAGFVREKMETFQSLLIVCNKKAQSEALFHLLKDDALDVFHLSASMCPAHRKDTLDKLFSSLSQTDRKTVCVSTQVIEAGVNISFACVIRLCAGLDSVVQAAGRCNRHGEAGSGILAPVYLINFMGENLGSLPDIQAGQDATQALLAEFRLHPDVYSNRLDSHQSVEYYYRTLYQRMNPHSQDYIWRKGQPSLFSLLSENITAQSEAGDAFYFRQAFLHAGSLFQVFEENTTDVIVPYGAGKEVIADLGSKRAKHDPAYLAKRLKDAKFYTIALYEHQIKRLAAENGLIPLEGGAFALNGHYSQESGFSLAQNELEFWGV